jgi:hypothetical protein
MTTQTKRTEEQMSANRDHIAWLKECTQWRSEHRQALAMLAKVQAAIFEQEAALETHAAQIRAHQMHLQEYTLAEYAEGTLDKEELEATHAEFAQKHVTSREVHERLRKHHLNIVDEVGKLLKRCGAAM